MLNAYLDNSSYFDFEIVKENPEYYRNYQDYKSFYIDVTQSLISTIGTTQTSEVILKNISLTGYDNFFIDIPPISGSPDPSIHYVVEPGDKFTLHHVSGYTGNFTYNITGATLNGQAFKKLNGGFYQGFFKLYNYPVEYFKARPNKGWTINTLLAFPVVDNTGTTFQSKINYATGFTTGITTGITSYDITQSTRTTDLSSDTGIMVALAGVDTTITKTITGITSGETINYLTGFTREYVSGTTLNLKYPNNEGFIFYLGTRAENKFSSLTPLEISRLNLEYNFNLKDTTDLYTANPIFLLNGKPYNGFYNIHNGNYYTGRKFHSPNSNVDNDINEDIQFENDINFDLNFGWESEEWGVISPETWGITDENEDEWENTNSLLNSYPLTINPDYSDIIDNAFGVRLFPDGRVGYRVIYATDPCYTGATQNPSGITNNSFIDYTDDCDTVTIRKIITKLFTIEEVISKYSVINLSEYKFLYLSTVFERDVTYNTDCELTYGKYRNGTLSIFVNGIIVFRYKHFSEIIPHKLDMFKNESITYYPQHLTISGNTTTDNVTKNLEPEFQEGVPFNLSFGGGTQGLLEAIYLDPTKKIDGILEKFFGGTFEGGVRSIDMYMTPLYVTEINELVDNIKEQFGLYIIEGGRSIDIKRLL